MFMSVELWRNNTDREKLKYSEKNLPTTILPTTNPHAMLRVSPVAIKKSHLWINYKLF
jgi:hypothetical protein